jgi:hypothetical protein
MFDVKAFVHLVDKFNVYFHQGEESVFSHEAPNLVEDKS